MLDNDTGNDDLMSSLFEGHDDILEDVQGDFSARLGETEMTVSDFTTPDTNPAILPIVTNCKERWNKIRPSVIAALQGLGHSVVGDEVVTILKKFNFRCMEARGFRTRESDLSSSAKGSGLSAHVDPSSRSAKLLREFSDGEKSEGSSVPVLDPSLFTFFLDSITRKLNFFRMVTTSSPTTL